MKKTIVLIFLLLFVLDGFSQVLPEYKMEFRYKTNSGAMKDTSCSRFAVSYWGQSGNFPACLKWKNQPFAIQLSPLNGVGLFTDSSGSYNAGQDIALVFYKQASTGKFALDYVESNPGMFVNNSAKPNAVVVITPNGLMMRALTHIGPNTEITASYQALLQLFPNDKTAERKIKYW